MFKLNIRGQIFHARDPMLVVEGKRDRPAPRRLEREQVAAKFGGHALAFGGLFEECEEILAFDEIRCPEPVDLAHGAEDLFGGGLPDLEQVHDVFPGPGLGCRVPDAVSELKRAVFPRNGLCHLSASRGREVPVDQLIPALFESTVKAPDWAFISWIRVRSNLR